MKRILLSALLLGGLMLAVAQVKKEDLATQNTKSPGAETSVTINGKNLWIYYHAPSMRGRHIFNGAGALQPDGSVWLLGADYATVLHTDADLDLNGLAIPKGDYTLYADLDNGQWKLIVNKTLMAGDRHIWGVGKSPDDIREGATTDDPATELGRASLTMGKPSSPVETLKITLSGAGGAKGKLLMEWENVTASAPFTVAVSGQQAASRGNAPADIVYAQPGQLIDAGGFRLNLYCMGSGSPTVVFDSGWGDWAPAWSKVQPEIAKWTRACSYDRAGAGFSDPGPMPRTSVHIAQELRTALHHAGIGGPYILVGSAFGGDNVRTFADLYMDEVAGLVLDDADTTDIEPKAMQEEEHRGLAGIPKDMRECRDLIAEHKPLPVTSRPGRPQQTCAQQFFFRGLPEAEWSPELNAKVLEIAQTKVAMYDSYSSEMEQTAADETYLQQHRRSFGSRPIRVLTSGNHAVGHLETKPPDTPKHLKYEQEITLAQARWLKLSSNSKQIFAHNSSEYIQLDEPETVIKAIREVYDQTKRP